MKDNFKDKIFDFFTSPKVVKIATITAFLVVFSTLIIGYIIAAIYGPLGYNMIDNYISDMGSIKYTPFPYMRTISNLIASLLFMPITFYLKKQLAPRGMENSFQDRLRKATIGFIGMLMIFSGMICSGIITEDVHMRAHVFFAIIAISGGILSTISYGLLILQSKTEIHKNVGIYMILSLPTIFILLIIGFPSRIFYEWVFLLSFYTWVIFCSFYLLR